jgi:hypothetical protein
MGLRKAWNKGRMRGIAEILQRLLTTKFGPLPPAVAARVASASHAELANWAARVLSAATLDDVFDV